MILHTRLAAVAPIAGVSIGDPADKTTWRVDFRDEATPEQCAAALSALNAFDPDIPTEADFAAAIQAHIDGTARAREYNDAVTCASYAASTIPAWRADGEAFVSWRDGVWAYAFEQLALVQAGQRTQPTIAELIAELPPIAWPM